MTKDEALKIAYEALEYNDHLRGQAITAIKQALAQPEPDPVATVYEGAIAKWNLPEKFTGFLYTSPSRRKPLTDEQEEILNFLLGASDIDDVWFGDRHPTEKGQFWWRNRLRKAFQEAAHGIKE